MSQTTDPITLSFPRTVLSDIVELSNELADRMHALLEQNTEGQLSSAERAELQTLVRIAELSQIMSTALQMQGVR